MRLSTRAAKSHSVLSQNCVTYWRVTFDHPPINTITATTVSELSELIALIERDTRLNVIVFDSANPDFFLAHYDVEGDPRRTSTLPPGPTGQFPWLDWTVRFVSSSGRQHRRDPRPRTRRRQRIRACLRPEVCLT